MLKNASAEVTLLSKNVFFLKILNFVQSFMECYVSLADGILFFFTTALSTEVITLYSFGSVSYDNDRK